MARLGLLTFHRVQNFGATLQAWSMVQLLGRHGEVSVLDYPTMHEASRHRRRGLRALIPSPGRWLFDRFIARLPLTERLPDSAAIADHVADAGYSALVCGSDQVWLAAPDQPLDAPFFLDFGREDGVPRISYAPSCGPIGDFGPHAGRIRAALSRFHAVSVRDAYSKHLVEALDPRPIALVADPTLVADLSPLAATRPRRRPYLALVGPHGPSEAALARRIAARRGLEVVAVGARSFDGIPSHRFISPSRWASLIAHADFVMTSLFHGTALSIAFRRSFLALGAANRGFKIVDMLGRLGAPDRLVGQVDEKVIAGADRLAECPYDAIEPRLTSWIETSRRHLDSSIRSALASTPLARVA